MITTSTSYIKRISVEHKNVEGTPGAIIYLKSGVRGQTSFTLSESQVSELKNKLQEIIDQI